MQQFSPICYTWLQINITFWDVALLHLHLSSRATSFCADPDFGLLSSAHFFFSAPVRRSFSSICSEPSSSELNFGKFSWDTSHWGLQFKISSSPSLAVMVVTPKFLQRILTDNCTAATIIIFQQMAVCFRYGCLNKYCHISSRTL
jgi:hypothetical protein